MPEDSLSLREKGGEVEGGGNKREEPRVGLEN